MKRNQNILPAIGIGVVILLNIVFFGWLLADFFSGSNGPEETVAATGSEEETTDEETTGEETTESVESTPEETPSPKQIVGEVPLQDAKRVIHTFSWGNGEGQLGYNESEGDILRPQAFVVEDDVIYILDNANQRVLICENGRYSEIDLEHLPNISDMVYQNGWLAILDNSENVTKLYRNDNGVEMSVDLPEIVTRMGAVKQILEIGDAYIVWEFVMQVSGESKAYRYDWATGQTKVVEMPEQPDFSVPESGFQMIGNRGEDVYYYFTDDSYAKVITCENDQYRLYTKLGYHPVVPSEFVYLSADGHLYLMECFQSRVEVSELVFQEESAIVPDEQGTENTGAEESTEALEPTGEQPSELISATVSLDDTKNVIHTFSWGDGEQQLGFYGAVGTEDFYTRAFSVENGNLYLLDEVNHRILFWENGQYSTIDISSVLQPGAMLYDNGRFAVYDKSRKVTVIFNQDGSEEIGVRIPWEFGSMRLERLQEIGDTYVELLVKRHSPENYLEPSLLLHYDWAEDIWELKGTSENRKFSGSYLLDINKNINFTNTYEIFRETEKYRLYLRVSDPTQPRMDGEMVYLSDDGHLYLLECFETHAQICELKLEDEYAILPEEPLRYEVLDGYFENRESLYNKTEKPELEPELWEYIQERKKQSLITIPNVEVSYGGAMKLSETETEVKLWVGETVKFKDSSATIAIFYHIIRLSKQGEEYTVVADSYYDESGGYEAGLKEDIELLKTRGW